jgi:hypothetical protein
MNKITNTEEEYRSFTVSSNKSLDGMFRFLKDFFRKGSTEEIMTGNRKS